MSASSTGPVPFPILTISICVHKHNTLCMPADPTLFSVLPILLSPSSAAIKTLGRSQGHESVSCICLTGAYLSALGPVVRAPLFFSLMKRETLLAFFRNSWWIHARTHDTRNERNSPGFGIYSFKREGKPPQTDTIRHIHIQGLGPSYQSQPSPRRRRGPGRKTGSASSLVAGGWFQFQITLQISKQEIESPFFEASVAVLTRMTPPIRPSAL